MSEGEAENKGARKAGRVVIGKEGRKGAKGPQVWKEGWLRM